MIMRYFLISYAYRPLFRIRIGYFCIKHIQFPSISEIKEIKEIQGIVILNISEFKNKEDHDNFNK